MSYCAMVRISCDHEGCEETYTYSRRQKGGVSKTYAGYRAQVDGWYVPGHAMSTDPKVAYCPKHRKEHGK